MLPVAQGVEGRRWAWGEVGLEAYVRASSPCGQWESARGIGMREKDATALLFRRKPLGAVPRAGWRDKGR